jgi:hypothetical protein
MQFGWKLRLKALGAEKLKRIKNTWQGAHRKDYCIVYQILGLMCVAIPNKKSRAFLTLVGNSIDG